MPNDSITIKGLEEVSGMLRRLGKSATAVIRKGLKAGGAVVRTTERSEAPRRTGKLARSITVKGVRGGKGRTVIGVFPRTQVFEKGKYYPAMVIHGHPVGKKHRVMVPPNEFPARAFSSSGRTAAEAATKTILSEIDKLIKS